MPDELFEGTIPTYYDGTIHGDYYPLDLWGAWPGNAPWSPYPEPDEGTKIPPDAIKWPTQPNLREEPRCDEHHGNCGWEKP
jgi:hypothetical protein